MTTGHIRVSSAGMVADAFATFLDDRFRLRTDAISARRRLVASLFAVATPLVDDGGRQVARLVGRAGEALWRGAQKTEQVGASVADEAADAGREGARALRDAAADRRVRRSGDEGAPPQQETGDVDDVLEVVEVVEVREPDLGPLEGALDGGPTAADLAAESLVGEQEDPDELDDVVDDELDHDLDDDLLGEDVPAEETLPQPPAVLTGATEIGGDRGDVVPEVVDDVEDLDGVGEIDEVVGEADVARIIADPDPEPERRASRRSPAARPRSASRPARRDRPREDRREVASGGRERRA